MAFRAPGIDSTPPQHLVATVPPTGREWSRWELSGPVKIVLGQTVFRLPMGSEVKVRGPLGWVRTGQLVHVISAAGDLDLSARERLSYAADETWKLV